MKNGGCNEEKHRSRDLWPVAYIILVSFLLLFPCTYLSYFLYIAEQIQIHFVLQRIVCLKLRIGGVCTLMYSDVF